MRKHILLLLAMFPLAAQPRTWAQDVPKEAPTVSDSPSTTKDRALFERVVANQKKSDGAMDVYERTERVESRKSAGSPQQPEVKIARVIPAGTGMVKLPIGPDGKPTDAEVYRSALEKLEQ